MKYKKKLLIKNNLNAAQIEKSNNV